MSAGDKYFQGNPVRLDISRSKFPLNHNWRGTLDAGYWIPFYTQEVLAGDTFKVGANVLLRSSTPVAPVMDNATISVEFFYVPFDLILSRSYMSPSLTEGTRSWRFFFGAQDSLLNMPTPVTGDTATLPGLDVTAANYQVGSLADCLGIPKPHGDGAKYSINALKALAYYAVYNEYLRDPNVMNPVTFSISSNKVQFSSNSDIGLDGGTVDYCKLPLVPAAANHGFFGSALPWPQRNTSSVTLPLGDVAPVIDQNGNKGGSGDPYLFYLKSDQVPSTSPTSQAITTYQPSEGTSMGLYTDQTVIKEIAFGRGINSIGTATGLKADLSNATAASINSIRAAFATQRWFEQLARSGNRYDEMIQGMFGVTPPAKGIKPEYLGGRDIPLNVSQVNGTAGDDLGAAGAISNTYDSGYYFTKSFTEPGLIIGLMCVRTHDSFSEGIDPFDLKRQRFDFYWPQFANTGEVALTKKLLFVSGTQSGEFSSLDDGTFGYQEYAADYRYHPDVVTGYFRPETGSGLPNWTYTNYFGSHPTLKSFLKGGDRFKSNVDRTLKVQSETAGYQFFGMVHLDVTAVRPMPLYSIPGLLDHH